MGRPRAMLYLFLGILAFSTVTNHVMADEESDDELTSGNKEGNHGDLDDEDEMAMDRTTERSVHGSTTMSDGDTENGESSDSGPDDHTTSSMKSNHTNDGTDMEHSTTPSMNRSGSTSGMDSETGHGTSHSSVGTTAMPVEDESKNSTEGMDDDRFSRGRGQVFDKPNENNVLRLMASVVAHEYSLNNTEDETEMKVDELQYAEILYRFTDETMDYVAVYMEFGLIESECQKRTIKSARQIERCPGMPQYGIIATCKSDVELLVETDPDTGDQRVIHKILDVICREPKSKMEAKSGKNSMNSSTTQAPGDETNAPKMTPAPIDETNAAKMTQAPADETNAPKTSELEEDDM